MTTKSFGVPGDPRHVAQYFGWHVLPKGCLRGPNPDSVDTNRVLSLVQLLISNEDEKADGRAIKRILVETARCDWDSPGVYTIPVNVIRTEFPVQEWQTTRRFLYVMNEESKAQGIRQLDAIKMWSAKDLGSLVMNGIRVAIIVAEPRNGARLSLPDQPAYDMRVLYQQPEAPV